MAAAAASGTGHPRPARPRIGVSSCLLGEQVRFNGGHSRCRFLTDELGAHAEWVPCCPEITTYARRPAGRPHGTVVAATPPGERHGLPALMAAACLREDRWLVHHVAADLPVEEVARLADQVGAGLVVLSSAMSQTARRAQRAAEAITVARPHLTVLAGRPGEHLRDLLARAASPHVVSAN